MRDVLILLAWVALATVFLCAGALVLFVAAMDALRSLGVEPADLDDAEPAPVLPDHTRMCVRPYRYRPAHRLVPLWVDNPHRVGVPVSVVEETAVFL